jgi:uncharacterized protein
MIFAPWLMKFLAVVGTVAMFMVGGGILVHGFHVLDAGIRYLAAQFGNIAMVGPMLAAVIPALGGIVIGMIAGAAVLAVIVVGRRLRGG